LKVIVFILAASRRFSKEVKGEKWKRDAFVNPMTF
jgi:hypothetical protein